MKQSKFSDKDMNEERVPYAMTVFPAPATLSQSALQRAESRVEHEIEANSRIPSQYKVSRLLSRQ